MTQLAYRLRVEHGAIPVVTLILPTLVYPVVAPPSGEKQ